MGEIVKGLERALLTRPVPTKDAAVRFLLKAEKSSTKNVAVLLGISQRTVQRWVALLVSYESASRSGARAPSSTGQ